MAEADRPLRLALFAEQGHPDGSFRSGVTRLTGHLVDGCRHHGVEVDFFTYHREEGTDRDGCVRWHRAAPRLPVTVHGLRVDALDLLPLPNPRFRRPAEGRPYDVVLGTSPGIGTQGQLLARARGIPFAAIYTTDLPNYAEALVADPSRPLPFRRALGRLARRGAWAYLRWLYHRRRTDLVLVPTEAARADFVANVPARAQVLGRGADTLSFPESPPESHDPVRLLYVGRVDYGEKNLRVLEEVVDRVEGAVLRVVGDGDDLPRMRERLADRIDGGRVELTGRVDDTERLVSLYRSSDVFVFPSLYDTLGQVVLEAQRAGLPVVVRDQGGPPELVHNGETGFVTPDDAAFVQRVEELVADEELRRRMGRAAREHAESLPGWSDVIADLVGRLRALACGDPPAPPSAPDPSSSSERRASAV